MGDEGVDARQRGGGLSRIWSGLLFGLGFSISLVCVAGLALFASYRLSVRNQGEESSSTTWHKTFTPESGLSVLSHEPKRTPHNLKVLGIVANRGKDTWDLIRLEVDLFDSKDAFVGKCEGYSSGPILPEHQRYFTVDCKGDSADPIPEYSRYSVEVINASYQMRTGA
jgi:hypothetical protein